MAVISSSWRIFTMAGIVILIPCVQPGQPGAQ